MQQRLRLSHVGLFCFQLQFRLLQIHLHGLNLHGIGQLLAAARIGPLVLQFGNLVLIVLDSGLQLLLLQLLLIQVQLQLFGVIGEQLVAGFHGVPGFHKQLTHGLVGVPLNLRYVLRDHNAREPVSIGDAEAAQVSHVLHIHAAGLAGTGHQAQAQCQGQNGRNASFFHIPKPPHGSFD